MSTPQTLIVLHGNRYIEVFTTDCHSTKIIAVPFMASAAGEICVKAFKKCTPSERLSILEELNRGAS